MTFFIIAALFIDLASLPSFDAMNYVREIIGLGVMLPVSIGLDYAASRRKGE